MNHEHKALPPLGEDDWLPITSDGSSGPDVSAGQLDDARGLGTARLAGDGQEVDGLQGAGVVRETGVVRQASEAGETREVRETDEPAEPETLLGSKPGSSSLERNCRAVLVTEADNPRLSRVLSAVADQTLQPARVQIVVLGEETERARDLAERHLGEAEIPFTVETSEAKTFSAAVQGVIGGRVDGENSDDDRPDTQNPDTQNPDTQNEGSNLPRGKHGLHTQQGQETQEQQETQGQEGEESQETGTWLWLLHGDVAPYPDCLEWLVRRGSASSKIGALGPKQVSWQNRADLLEVGIRATRSGRRVPEIGKGDRDQGQLDAREDVLGVGSAGMLVRASALQQIGGLDPALGPFGDGLETSRRLWAGGWRVTVVPRAVVRHAQESMSRPARATFADRRAAQLYNALLAAPLIFVPFMWIGYILAAPIRALIRLAMKEPGMAWPELKGGFSVIGRTGDLWAGRRRLRAASSVSGSVLRTLEDSPKDVRAAQRADRKAQKDAAEMAVLPDPITLAEQRQYTRSTRSWAFATFLVTTIVGVAGMLGVIGRGVLAGGALLADDSSFGDLVSMAASGWLPSGSGSPGQVDALWLVLSPLVAISQPLGGSLGSVATAVILLALPLAGLAAYRAAGTFTLSPLLRFVAGLLWAFAPPLLGSIQAGQVAGVIWHVLAPLGVSLLVRCWRGNSISLVARASLVLAIMSAAAPLTIVLVIGIIAAAVIRRAWRWLWIPIPALVLMAPTFIAADNWRVLFAVPGAAVAGQPSGLNILTLNPVASSDLNLIAATGIAAIALVGVLALVRRHRTAWIRWGWVVVTLGYLWALADSFITTAISTANGTLTPVNAWAGIALSLAALGLWLVLVNAGDGMRARVRQYSFGLHQLGAGIIVLAVTYGMVAPAGIWVANNARQAPLEAAGNTIPAIAVTDQQSADRSRVLMLVPGPDGIEAKVLRGNGIQLHETSMASGVEDVAGLNGDAWGDPAREELAEAIADVSGNGERAASLLGEQAISMVVVPDTGTDSAALVGQLSSLGGLQYVTQNQIGAFWRVRTDTESGATATSRLRISEPSGLTEAGGVNTDTALASGTIGADVEIEPGRDGRLLVLAERADPAWNATLNGKSLKPEDHGWRQAWRLPADGGDVVISHGTIWPAIAQVSVMGIAIVMALPLRRKRYES